MSSSSSSDSSTLVTQNLPPIMPFIEPIEPIELPSVFDLQNSIVNQNSTQEARRQSNPNGNPIDYPSNQSNLNSWKGKATAQNQPSNHKSADQPRRKTSEEEA